MNRILQSISMMIVVSNVIACSGGGGEPELVQPTQAVSEPVEPTTPSNPPVPTEPTPPNPTAPPPTIPPVKPPTIPREPPVPPQPPAAIMPSGIWKGVTRQEGRNVLGVVLQDGRSWFLSSTSGEPHGVIAGTMTTSTATWTSNRASYNVPNLGVRAKLNASGTWVPKQRLVGDSVVVQVEAPPLSEIPVQDRVELAYDPQSEQVFSMSRAAGRYKSEHQDIILNADGSISAEPSALDGETLRYGCTFTGRATTNGSVATVTVTYSGGECFEEVTTVQGVITVDASGTLHAMGVSADQKRTLEFIGTR